MTTLEIKHDAPTTPEQSADWLTLMAGPNRAGQPEVAERARTFVDECVRATETRMATLYKLWSMKDHMLRGNSLAPVIGRDKGVHVPEIRKGLDRMVPRLVQLIWENQSPFRVHGRDPDDKKRVETSVQPYLYYLTDISKAKRLTEPISRSLLTYGVACVKAHWAVDFRDDRVPVRELDTSGDFPVTKVRIENKKTMTYEGPRYDLVDAYDLVLDLDAKEAEQLQYIGDRSMVSRAFAKQMADDGLWLDFDEQLVRSTGVAGVAPNPTWSTTEQYKNLRSLTRTGFGAQGSLPLQMGSGANSRLRCTELWALWQAEEDGDWDEYQIVVLDNQVVRVAKNPFRSKHRPYAVSFYDRNGTDLIGPAQIDAAIPPQIEFDQFRNVANLANRNAVSPIIVARGVDAPGSIFEVRPGTILRGINSDASLDALKLPSVSGEIAATTAMYRNEIEETIGAPRIYSGADATGTATEIERRIEEANRLMSFAANKVGDVHSQMAQLGYLLARQFQLVPKPYRVIGGGAPGLEFLTIKPEDLQDPVDIIFLGPENVSTYGLRATRVSTFSNQYGQLTMQLLQTGELDPKRWWLQGWKDIVGTELASGTLDESDDSPLLTVAEENMLFSTGGETPVRDGDDHNQHLSGHKAGMRKLNTADSRMRLGRHMARHMEKKRIAAQKEAQRAKMASLMPQEGPSGNLAPQEGRSGRSGGFQRPSDMNPGDPTQTPPGETPGPPAMARMSASDRSPATFQTDNRR